MMADARPRGSVVRTGLASALLCVIAFLAGALWEKAANAALQRQDAAAAVASALAPQRAALASPLSQPQPVVQQQAGLSQAQVVQAVRQAMAAAPTAERAVAAQSAIAFPQQQQHAVAARRDAPGGLASIIDVCDFPRPSPALAHYDATYFGWQVKENQNNVRWQRARLKPSLEVAPRAAVFEVGCSGGYTLASISAGSKHCFEVNDVAIAHAAQKFPDIRVYKRWADVPDDTMDYAYSFDSFEHHVSPLDNLMCLYAKMRRGGTVHIEVPYEHGSFGGNSPNVHGRRWKPGDVNNHLFTWSPLLLGNFVTAAGFRVTACRDGEEMWRIWKAEGRQAAPGPREVLAVWCLGVKD